MSTRFEINVENGRYIVYDGLWDTISYYKDVNDVKSLTDPKDTAVIAVDKLVKNGDKHTWFAGGESGFGPEFHTPITEVYPIPGRFRRYIKQ